MIVGIGLGQQQTINFSAPPPSSVGSVSYSVTGNPGTGSAYYWVVARYVSGNASPKSVRAINIPAPLNNSQYVTVRWTPVTVQPPNTTGSYDVLKTITSTIPGGNCACALATGVSGTSYNDKGGALGAYVVQTEGTAKGTITLNNSGATPEFVFVPPIPLSNFVPYSGAVKDVDLGNNSLTTNNLTVNGTCTGCGGGGSGLFSNTVTLQASDILSLYPAPFTLVPSCGVSCAIAVQWIDISYHFVSQDYKLNAPVADCFAGILSILVTIPCINIFPNRGADVKNEIPQSSFWGQQWPTNDTGKAAVDLDGLPVILNSENPLTGGSLVTASVVAGGANYTNGDTGTVNCGNGDPLGAYTVATSTGGSVDTVTVSGGYGIAGGFETCTTVPTAGAAAPLTASVVAGGLLYVNGDQGTISGCGDGTSIYTVTSSLGGVVSAVTITGGTNYVLGGPCSTTVTGGSGDGNLTLNITGVGGDGNLTLTPTSVTGVGDSTITVTTYYTKIQ
jgi:hypothetical protein